MLIKGGMAVDADSRIRTQFSHNPSTLRLSAHSPNLMQIPHANGLGGMVKEIFIAPEGFTFYERDFSAVEAVLTFYFAGCPHGIRLAKLGVHDFFTSHILGKPADLSWSDDDLRSYFKQIKRDHPEVREAAKRIIHGSHYMMTPARMWQLYPEYFPSVKEAAKLQNLYFELFPEIRKWHRDTCLRIDGMKRKFGEEGEIVDPWTLGVCNVRNPFGYIHRFYSVLDWNRVELPDGSKIWDWHFGEDAKRAIAFLPQSTAAAIIKKVAKEIYYDYPWVGQSMRLLVHDSIIGECRNEDLAECLKVSADVMEAPIKELPLDPSWNLGEYLTIGTEAKTGKSWASME